MILDTCFLIDLHRELRDGADLSAIAFLNRFPQQGFYISTVTAMEFLESFEDAREGSPLLSPFRAIPFDEGCATTASRIRRTLRQQGQLIGDLDILIAASAVHTSRELVTNNVQHFSRIPEIGCIPHRP